MPELPEVETVVRTLENKINQRTIKKVRVLWPNLIENVTVQEFEKRLVGQRFNSFERYGKFLIFKLDTETLIVHLRMEGKFFVYPDNPKAIKHSHVVFELDKGQLQYNDVRKFGRFYLYKKDEEYSVLNKLGLEPWDKKLTSEYLKQYCRKISTPIKSQLLDQGMIAGIGNIYANEICFEVSLNPNHPARFISRNKWDEIIRATQRILKKAIKQGGTTIRSYTSSLGVTGLFQQELNVHSREHEDCHNCNETIVKTFIKGRGTYYCPNCQKEKPLMVAITGNIGSGKSTVTNYLSKMNYPTISCDEVNSRLLNLTSTKEVLARIFECKPNEVTKDLIRERIYQDKMIKKQVEETLHQLIWKEIDSFYHQQKTQMVFVEVPLLFETDWYKRFDCNILVTSSKDNIIKRLKTKRKMSEEDIISVLENQQEDSQKIELADILLKNDSDLKSLKISIEKALNSIVKLLPKDEQNGL